MRFHSYRNYFLFHSNYHLNDPNIKIKCLAKFRKRFKKKNKITCSTFWRIHNPNGDLESI